MLVVCVFPQVDQSVTPQYSRNSLTQYIEANSIFTIREVGVQDTGIYTCTAQTDSLAKKDMKKATMVIVHGKRVVTHMRAAIVTHTHGVSLRFWTWIRPSSKLFFFFFFGGILFSVLDKGLQHMHIREAFHPANLGSCKQIYTSTLWHLLWVAQGLHEKEVTKANMV